MVLVLLALAAALTALRPLVREPLRRFERYARVSLNERDLYRHLNDGRGVAERFAQALRSGRYEDAWASTTADFQRRTGLHEFSGVAKQSALGRPPIELVEGVMSFSDGRVQFVSEYVFRCGPEGDRVALILVTESGRLRVDRIEPKEPTRASTP
jgi:hypothetical protein